MSKRDILADVLANSIKYGPKVVGIVKSIRHLFGKGKTGAEKAALARQAIKDSEAVAEGVANRDLVNGEVIEELMAESVELGYQIMKAEDRLHQIGELLKRARATSPAPSES